MNLLEYSVLLWYRNLPKLSGDFLNFNFFNFKYWITKRWQSASNIHQPNCSLNRSLHWSSTLFKLIPKYYLSIDFPQKIYFVIYSSHNPKILVVVLSVFESVFFMRGEFMLNFFIKPYFLWIIATKNNVKYLLIRFRKCIMQGVLWCLNVIPEKVHTLLQE